MYILPKDLICIIAEYEEDSWGIDDDMRKTYITRFLKDEVSDKNITIGPKLTHKHISIESIFSLCRIVAKSQSQEDVSILRNIYSDNFYEPLASKLLKLQNSTEDICRSIYKTLDAGNSLWFEYLFYKNTTFINSMRYNIYDNKTSIIFTIYYLFKRDDNLDYLKYNHVCTEDINRAMRILIYGFCLTEEEQIKTCIHLLYTLTEDDCKFTFDLYLFIDMISNQTHMWKFIYDIMTYSVKRENKEEIEEKYSSYNADFEKLNKGFHKLRSCTYDEKFDYIYSICDEEIELLRFIVHIEDYNSLDVGLYKRYHNLDISGYIKDDYFSYSRHYIRLLSRHIYNEETIETVLDIIVDVHGELVWQCIRETIKDSINKDIIINYVRKNSSKLKKRKYIDVSSYLPESSDDDSDNDNDSNRDSDNDNDSNRDSDNDNDSNRDLDNDY